MNKKILSFSISLSLSFPLICSAETALNYPELEVTPRASERLLMLAKKERNNHFFSELPMQISAVATLTTGILQKGDVDEIKDPEKQSPNIGILVGSIWLGVNYYLSQRYQIYQNSYNEISKMSDKSPREQLLRERLAEEGINDAARIANRMKWLSIGTNFGANAYMIGKAKKQSKGQYMGVLSLFASVGPLLFAPDWEKVAEDQNSYKKKVYGPIFTTSLFQTGNGQFSPGLLASLSF